MEHRARKEAREIRNNTQYDRPHRYPPAEWSTLLPIPIDLTALRLHHEFWEHHDYVLHNNCLWLVDKFLMHKSDKLMDISQQSKTWFNTINNSEINTKKQSNFIPMLDVFYKSFSLNFADFHRLIFVDFHFHSRNGSNLCLCKTMFSTRIKY